jgi:hypothetical protein
MKTPASAPSCVVAWRNRSTATSVVGASPMAGRISIKRAPYSGERVNAARVCDSPFAAECFMAFTTKLVVQHRVFEPNGFRSAPAVERIHVGEHHCLHQARSDGLALSPLDQESQGRRPKVERDCVVLRCQAPLVLVVRSVLRWRSRSGARGPLSSDLQRSALRAQRPRRFIDSVDASLGERRRQSRSAPLTMRRWGGIQCSSVAPAGLEGRWTARSGGCAAACRDGQPL